MVQCSEGVVRPGDVWVVQGRGMPRGNGGFGDLLVRFQVDFPTQLPEANGASLRDQLRPLLDPKAPAKPSAGGARGWFGLSGSGGGASPVAAVRAPDHRASRVEALLEAHRREERAEREGRGRDGGAECRQM